MALACVRSGVRGCGFGECRSARKPLALPKDVLSRAMAWATASDQADVLVAATARETCLECQLENQGFEAETYFFLTAMFEFLFKGFIYKGPGLPFI